MPQPETIVTSSENPLKLARTWYACGVMMLIVVALVSLLPAPDVGVSDKLSHLLTYFVLGAWFGMLARDPVVLVWTLIALIAYGMLLELLQGQTGYRFAEWGDVIANSVGAFVGVVLYFTPLRHLFHSVDKRLSAIL